MGSNFFDLLNKLATNHPIDDEVARSASPFMINRWINFSGLTEIAVYLNKFSFVFPSQTWVRLAQKTLPNRYVKWSYIKKKEKIEDGFFVEDIAKYYKINKKRAKEALTILSNGEQMRLGKKFGYTEKQLKGLGFKVPKVKKNQVKQLSEWW